MPVLPPSGTNTINIQSSLDADTTDFGTTYNYTNCLRVTGKPNLYPGLNFFLTERPPIRSSTQQWPLYNIPPVSVIASVGGHNYNVADSFENLGKKPPAGETASGWPDYTIDIDPSNPTRPLYYTFRNAVNAGRRMADWFDFQTLTLGKGNVANESGVPNTYGGAVLIENLAEPVEESGFIGSWDQSWTSGEQVGTFVNYGLFGHPSDKVSNVLYNTSGTPTQPQLDEFKPLNDSTANGAPNYYQYWTNYPNKTKLQVGYSQNAATFWSGGNNSPRQAHRAGLAPGSPSTGSSTIFELRSYADYVYTTLYSMKKQCDLRALCYPAFIFFKHDSKEILKFPMLVGCQTENPLTSPKCWRSSVWRSIVADSSRYTGTTIYQEFDPNTSTWTNKTFQQAWVEAGSPPWDNDQLYNGSEKNREFHRRMAPYFYKLYDYAMYRIAYAVAKEVFPNAKVANYNTFFATPQMDATGTRKWNNWYSKVWEPDENWKYWPTKVFPSKKHLRGDVGILPSVPPKVNPTRKTSYHFSRSLTHNSFQSLDSLTASSGITDFVHPFPAPGLTLSWDFATYPICQTSRLVSYPPGNTNFRIHHPEGDGSMTACIESAYNLMTSVERSSAGFDKTLWSPNLPYILSSVLSGVNTSSFQPRSANPYYREASNPQLLFGYANSSSVMQTIPGVTGPSSPLSLFNIPIYMQNYHALGVYFNCESRLDACTTGGNSNHLPIAAWFKAPPAYYPKRNNYNCPFCPEHGQPPFPHNGKTYQFYNEDSYPWNSVDFTGFYGKGVRDFIIESKKWFNNDFSFYNKFGTNPGTDLRSDRAFAFGQLINLSVALSGHLRWSGLYGTDLNNNSSANSASTIGFWGGGRNPSRAVPRPFPDFNEYDPTYVDPTVSPLTISNIISPINLTADIDLALQIPNPRPFTVVGGRGNVNVSIVGGTSLPSGINYNSTTGLLSGKSTLTNLDTSVVTFRATDDVGVVDTPIRFNITPSISPTISVTLPNVYRNTSSPALSDDQSNTIIPITGSSPYGPVIVEGPNTLFFPGNVFPEWQILENGRLFGGYAEPPERPITIRNPSVMNARIRDLITSKTTSTSSFNLYVAQALNTYLAVPSVNLQSTISYSSFAPVTADGGRTPLTYSISPPSLPSGMNFSSTTGVISGTPTSTLSSTTYTVTVNDTPPSNTTQQTSSKSFQLVVNNPPPRPTANVAISSLTVKRTIPIQYTSSGGVVPRPITGSGGTGTLTYSITSGSLPTGLSLVSTTGEITGTPSSIATLGSSTITIRVTDSYSTPQFSEASFGITVEDTPPAPTLTKNSSIPATTIFTTVNSPVNIIPAIASGGFAPYTYEIISGTIPTGITFSTATGLLSGTPTATLANNSITIRVRDIRNSASYQSTLDLSIQADNTLTSALSYSTLNMIRFTPITSSQPLVPSNGSTPYTYSISPATQAGNSFNLSPVGSGITLSRTTGFISGTPQILISPTNYTVTITDAAGRTTSGIFTAVCTAEAVPLSFTVTNMTIRAGVEITPTTPVRATGGTGTLTYSITSGSLPTGLSFNSSTGEITGKVSRATTPGTQTLQITVTDSYTPPPPVSGSRTFTLTILAPFAPPTSSIQTGSRNINLYKNVPMTTTQPVIASGSYPPFNYIITSGTLPNFLSYQSGNLGGTPIVIAAPTNIVVMVEDVYGGTAPGVTFTVRVDNEIQTYLNTPSVGLQVSSAISPPFAPITADGGASPLVYSISPSLPSGLNFSSANGQLSGTPTQAKELIQHTVTVTDNVSRQKSATFDLQVLELPNSIVATTVVPTITVIRRVEMTPTIPVSVVGGVGVLNYSIAPTLPLGLTMNDGIVSGKPALTAAFGASGYTMSITDDLIPPQSATAMFDINVTDPPVVTTTINNSIIRFTVDKEVNSVIPISGGGGYGTLSYGISPSLTYGLNFSTINGAITGKPDSSFLTNYNVTVTDSLGQTADDSFFIEVVKKFEALVDIPDVVLVRGANVPYIYPISGTGGSGPYSYTISPPMISPMNYSLDVSGGITATDIPLRNIDKTTHEVTVTDLLNNTDTAIFTFEVVSSPSFGGAVRRFISN